MNIFDPAPGSPEGTVANAVFTPEDRARVRNALLDLASRDTRITGAAVTGSGAESREDRWSDVDLAFGVQTGADFPKVLADWTERMYAVYGALHHVDMVAGAWTYRVFLLPGTLQVDLAFVFERAFCALGPTFRLVFGKAGEPKEMPSPPGAAEFTIGMAWLYALHARSSLARKKLWQAEYMISGVRDHALALACIRHGLPAVHARGMDLLPDDVTAAFRESLVRELEVSELGRAFGAATRGLIREIRLADETLGARLEGALRELGERFPVLGVECQRTNEAG